MTSNSHASTSLAPSPRLPYGQPAEAPCPAPRRALARPTALERSARRPSASPPSSRSPLASVTFAASVQPFGLSRSPELTPPLSRSGSSAGTPPIEAASPLSRPSSPELLTAAPFAYGLRLEPLDELRALGTTPATQGTPTYASRFVMPIVRGGGELNEFAEEFGGSRARLGAGEWKQVQASAKAARPSLKGAASAAKAQLPLPKSAKFAGLMGIVDMPYWHEVKRLAALVPSEVVGIAGLVPTAYTNAQNTRYGFRRLLFFWHLHRACQALTHTLMPPCAPARHEDFRRAWVETCATFRGISEASFFMSFNVVEHISLLLAALPLASRLVGAIRFVPVLTRALSVATPALMALHAGLHLGRHVQGFLHSRTAQHAADTIDPHALDPESHARWLQLQRQNRHEQRVRLAWIAAWVAFEGGVAISSGFILNAASRPLWAGAWLGASFAVTKCLEWAFGTAVEAPLAILWPQNTSTAPSFLSLRWRAFGSLADNARAAACIDAQQQVMTTMEQSIWPLVPWKRRYALQGVMALGSLPWASALVDRLSSWWLVDYVDAATPIVGQAHERYWHLQSGLLSAEARQRGDGGTMESDEEPSLPGAWPPPSATTPTSSLPIRPAETEKPEPPASLKAQALGISLYRPRQALVDVRRALDWGGQTTLAACHDHTQVRSSGKIQ